VRVHRGADSAAGAADGARGGDHRRGGRHGGSKIKALKEAGAPVEVAMSPADWGRRW